MWVLSDFMFWGSTFVHRHVGFKRCYALHLLCAGMLVLSDFYALHVLCAGMLVLSDVLYFCAQACGF